MTMISPTPLMMVHQGQHQQREIKEPTWPRRCANRSGHNHFLHQRYEPHQLPIPKSHYNRVTDKIEAVGKHMWVYRCGKKPVIITSWQEDVLTSYLRATSHWQGGHDSAKKNTRWTALEPPILINDEEEGCTPLHHPS